VLVWVYYSSQLFLLGAEFTWVYAHSQGSLRATQPPAPVVAPSTRTEGINVPENGGAGALGSTPAKRRTPPAGADYLYAGMVSVAFGLAHWYLRAYPPTDTSTDPPVLASTGDPRGRMSPTDL
jgi:hypothetical protein